MAANLAIILGVTDYPAEVGELPACANDVAIMQDLLAGSGKFNEIFVAPSEDGKAVKARIADFVARFKNDDVEELFFYFTGHGEFVDDEFRFLLRDYSRSKPAQTSLSNSELDTFLRSLNPGLAVKVVDACYSGMPYIKDGSTFTDYMKAATEASFSKCYFLFSSQSDQRSWASSEFSEFTKVFVDSVAQSSLESIRYADVIDTLSDAFQATPRQRPLFVVQGDFTEILGNFPDPVRARLKERLAAVTQMSSAQPMVAKYSLTDLARNEARDYVSMEDAISVIDNLKRALEKFEPVSDITSLFQVETELHDDYKSIPSSETLGKWLSKTEQRYFASPILETETYEVESPINSLFAVIGKAAPSSTITKTRQIVAGVRTQLTGLPFISFSLLLKPQLPNLTQYGGWVTYFLSKTNIQAFYCFSAFKEVNWGEYRRTSPTEWEPINSKLTDANGPSTIAAAFTSKLEQFVESDVAKRLGADREETGASDTPNLLPAPKE